MKRLILMCGLLASGFSFGADWKYAAMGAMDDRAIYVDSSQYTYDKKSNSIKAWYKTVSYREKEGKETYTKSKDLYQFSCIDNRIKLLAYVNYNKNGDVVSSAQYDSKDVKYKIIIPDTIGEDLWEVACISKGGGFRYPKYQTGERLSKEEMEKIFPNGVGGGAQQGHEEMNDFNKGLSVQ